MASSRIDSDLFQPSLQEYQGCAGRPGERPWPLTSQLWVAFFGGVLATTVIAARDAHRLRAPQRVRSIWLLGAAALIVAVLAQAYAFSSGESRHVVRVIARGTALLVYLGHRQLLQRADRVHQATGGTYDSLWKPGLIAVFGLGIVEAALVLTLVLTVLS